MWQSLSLSVFKAGLYPLCYPGLVHRAVFKNNENRCRKAQQRKPYKVNITCGTELNFLIMERLSKKITSNLTMGDSI